MLLAFLSVDLTEAKMLYFTICLKKHDIQLQPKQNVQMAKKIHSHRKKECVNFKH